MTNRAYLASLLPLALAVGAACSGEVGVHDHADYAALAHTHTNYLDKTAFTGSNDTDCDNDTGYLLIGNIQDEFGCHITCTQMCERHGMTCDRAWSVSGTMRTCDSNINNDVLHCWCKG